jgi:hypothetical protein
MAVSVAFADVAVAMGPRNQRRLTSGGIGLAVIVAIVLAIALTRSANQPGPVSAGSATASPSGQKGDERYAANSGELVYGMTPHQVRALVGPPSKIAGTCWQYQLDEFRSDHGVARTYNADRICFYAGKFSEQYLEMNGQWYANGVVIPAPTH